MRACTATAVFAISFASVAAASAADMRVRDGVASGGFYAGGERAGQVVIYDSEPGVVVRPYWIPPWGYRHYFPATGKKPRVGRRENLAERGVYKPAQSYHRYWSTVTYGADPWRGPVPQYAVAPPPAPRRELRRELQLK